MTTTEEILVKLGLDSREFAQRLRQAQRDAQEVARIAEQGQRRRDSLDPALANSGYESVKNLSAKSQQLLAGGGTLAMFSQLKNSIAASNPLLGQFMDRLGSLGLRMGLLLAPIAAVRGAIKMMKSAFYDVKEAADLGVTTSFLSQLGRAAVRSGENVDEAKFRLLRFQQTLAAAAEGSKEAQAKLAQVGIKDPTGKTLEENLRQVAKAYENIGDRAKQAGIAVDLFGRGAQTSMPDILAELGNVGSGRNMLKEENKATLAAGWQASKRVMDETMGMAWREAKGVAEMYLADFLTWATGIKGEVEDPSKITKDPEVAAREKAEAAAKREKDLTDARKEYGKAVRDSWTAKQREQMTMIELWRTQEKLKAGVADELERTKLMTQELKLKAELAKAAEQRQDKEKQVADKLATLEKQKADMLKEQAQAAKDKHRWTVGELAARGQSEQGGFDESGRAIIAEEELQSIERAIGRMLSQREIDTMRDNLTVEMLKAQRVSDLEKSAKLGALFGFSDSTINSFDEQGRKMRGMMASLTSAEANPNANFERNQARMTEDIAELLATAQKDGIIIRPRMGK